MTLFAILRGINVGGHHKVPMAVLRDEMTTMGFGSVRTLLNSGNVIFESASEDPSSLETQIEARLASKFGFPIPVMIRTAASMSDLVESDPFSLILSEVKDPNIRLYITFTRSGENIPSVLDLRDSQTTKEMEQLEKRLGKDITTRNWNTIVKMVGR
jgi:uncharacterized protein (DUF1697 family)